MSVRKFNPKEPIKQYEKVLIPSWSEARAAMQQMQMAEGADHALRDRSFNDLAEKYPNLKSGR